MITLRLPDAELGGDLALPDAATGVVLFAHGSGSSRHSPRNRAVAQGLNAAGIGTLLIDLLTEHEDEIDRVTAALRFDIELLTLRLIGAIDALADGLESAPTPPDSASACSARAPAPPPPSPPPRPARRSARSSPAADAPTWQARPSLASGPPSC